MANVELNLDVVNYTDDGNTILSGRVIDLYFLFGAVAEANANADHVTQYKAMAKALCDEYKCDPEVVTWQVAARIWDDVHQRQKEQKKS